MENVIFYTQLDKVIGCTRPSFIKGEPFCDSCLGGRGTCQFTGQCTNNIEVLMKNEHQLKATFVKLYLEKVLRI